MLAGVLIFALSVIALLAMPLSLTYDVSSRKDYRNDVTVNWAFGLLRFGIPADRRGDAARDAETSEPVDDHSRHSSAAGQGGFVAIRQKAFRRRLLRFVGDLWHAVHKDDIRLNIRLGLGDPADTGMLWAFVGPVAGILDCTDDVAVSIVPDFFDAIFEIDSRGSVRLIPLHILCLTVALMLSPAVWRAGLAMRRAG